MPSIDAKISRRDPTNWQSLSATTSVLPFAAIAAHRNTLVWHEIGGIRALVAIAAWAAVLWLHPLVFGVAPIMLYCKTILGYPSTRAFFLVVVYV